MHIRRATTTSTQTRLAALALLFLAAQQSLLSQEPPKDAPVQRLPAVAVLKTDPEQQRLLHRAEQYAQENRPDLAATLYQKVLDEAGQTLVAEKVLAPIGPASTPLVIYRPLADSVQQSLNKQPQAVLDAYRTSADAEAHGLMAAAGDHSEQAMAEVVRRFFLSSVGDDAALQLASLALDQHDFVRALALLKKIAELHPDPSAPPAQLQARLAVAAAGAHDWQSAEQALAALRSMPVTDITPEAIERIVEHVNSAKQRLAVQTTGASAAWHMPFGNPERTGVMPALPASATIGDLAELASTDWPLPIPGLGSLNGPANVSETTVAGSTPSPARLAAAQEARASLIEQWRSGGWRPTGELRFDRSRVYFKTADHLVSYNKQSLAAQPLWQSGWQNRYELDALTQRHALLASQFGNLPKPANRPASLPEILLFGDRVHQSLAIHGDMIFSIEGKRATTAATSPRQQPPPWATSPRRSRTNWLTAYELSGGKAQWTRTAAVDDSETATDVGFLAAPTPCGDELLVPVTSGGTIWLYGLEPQTGRTLWTLYLCDEPSGGAPPWAQIILAASGREAYLTCGCGVAFAIDTVGRNIRWAAAYRRDGKVNATLRTAVGDAGAVLDFGGWDDDVVIPYGGLVVVMPSDSDRLLALDRRTGERVWESPRTSPLGSVANYCLGVHGRSLYVAGSSVVRRYDVLTGRLLQEREIEKSLGRCCLTEDALYMPVGSSILKYDLQLTDPPQKSLAVLENDEPLGNFFTDGQRLWILGAARVYTLTPLEERLHQLNDRIAACDAEAQLDRMRLYLKQGRLELALADLRHAYDRLKAQHPADQAADRLFAVLSEQRLPQEHPVVVLSLLTEQFLTGSPPPSLSADTQQRLADTLASCIAASRQHAASSTLSSLLAAAPLFKQDYLLTAATFAIDSIAKPNDVPLLLQTLDRAPLTSQLISIRAAARLAPAAVRQPLARLLRASDDRIRLAAARALANLGERNDILETLVALLESPLPSIRARSHQTLQALTGQRIPFAEGGSAADRASSVRAWRTWMQSQGARARLHVPLMEKSVSLGRILVVAPGVLVELDENRKERWRAKLAGAGWGCQGLPNGHRLVALNSHSSVVEYDESGREVWKKDRLPAPPTSVERLENGATLIACGNAQQLVEVTPDGALSRVNVPGNPIWAQRLESGNTLVALQQPIQRVVEVDAGGRIVWEARTGGDAPWHAVRLENGNTLVTLTQARKVVEFDPTGKSIVWATQVPLLQPVAAQRLASGTTVVADQTGLREIDASGKEILWQLRLPGLTGVSCF